MKGRPNTTRHYDVLKAIREYPGKGTPTLVQLSAATGYNVGTVNFYITRLIGEGLIYREKNSRTIELTGAEVNIPRPAKAKGVKASWVEVNLKKAEGATRGRKATKAERIAAEHDCFERAVKMGKARDMPDSLDVLHDRRSLFSSGRVRGEKVG